MQPAAILAELHRRGLIDNAATVPDPEADERQREADARDRAKRITAARWIWDETEPANWLIETYLGGRLILCPIPETIRLHRCPAPQGGRMPPAGDGLRGRARGTRLRGHPLHLSRSRTARVRPSAIEPVKRFIGPVGGGAVRLAPAVDTVAVCEGIETGLSYMEATGTPTWAALSAGGIRALILPEHIGDVIIAADPDPVGIMAASAAAKTLARRGPAASRSPGRRSGSTSTIWLGRCSDDGHAIPGRRAGHSVAGIQRGRARPRIFGTAQARAALSSRNGARGSNGTARAGNSKRHTALSTWRA